MENLQITDKEITWERTMTKHNSAIVYKSQILKHDDHISIHRIMYMDGKIKDTDLTHIPLELIDNIKDLVRS